MKRRHFLKKSTLITAGLVLPSVLMNCAKKQKENPTPEINSQKILVFGAGIAGLSAAKKLKEHGFNVQIIEASNRYGGRIISNDFEGYMADWGASWIHGISGNQLYSLANENAILTQPTYMDPSYIFDTDGTEITMEEWNTIEPYLEQLSDIAYNNPNMSLEGILAIIAPQLNLNERLTRLFYGALRSEIEIPYAVDAKDISARALLTEDSFDGDDVIFPSGMHQLTDVLAKDADIIYNTFVFKIDFSGSKIRIFTKKYEEVPEDRSCNACHNATNAVNITHDNIFEADKIVIALPMEMLKNGIISFVPSLPEEKQNALNGLQMGTMNKIFLKFEECFWNEDGFFLELLKNDHSHIIEFFNPVAVGEENILVGVLAGYHAKSIEYMSDEEVTELAMAELKGMYGEDIPQPVAIQRTAWHTNPLSLGCYPHLKPGFTMDICDTIAQPINDKVFFAGDSTSKNYLATAHGAYISGQRAAKEIMDIVNK